MLCCPRPPSRSPQLQFPKFRSGADGGTFPDVCKDPGTGFTPLDVFEKLAKVKYFNHTRLYHHLSPRPVPALPRVPVRHWLSHCPHGRLHCSGHRHVGGRSEGALCLCSVGCLYVAVESSHAELAIPRKKGSLTLCLFVPGSWLWY